MSDTATLPALPELDSIPLLRGLTREQLAQIGASLRRRTLPAGAALMNVEQFGEAVYFIVGGTVKIHLAGEQGDEVIIAILGAGDIVGEMSLLDGAERCANVTTIEPTKLLWLDRAAFRDCVRTMPALAFNLSGVLAQRLRQANEQIQALATRDIECRIARQLIAFAERYGKAAANGGVFIPVRLTQTDIAGLVGATRESVNKIIVSYKERGWLAVDRAHHLTVYNRQALTGRCG